MFLRVKVYNKALGPGMDFGSHRLTLARDLVDIANKIERSDEVIEGILVRDNEAYAQYWVTED